jgi:hypothetical protein
MNAAGAQRPRPITGPVFAQVVVLDLLLDATLLWRDYAIDSQVLVAHYVLFVAGTDLAAYFLPKDKRQWYNLFRLVSGPVLLALTATLATKGLDGGVLALTLARCLFAGLRTLHAAWLIRRSGPREDELVGFPAYAASYVRSGGASERLSAGFLLFAGLALIFPQFVYWMHQNTGPRELDAVIVGLQASQGFTVWIKMFVLETLVVRAAPKLAMRTVVAVLFVGQWPFMLTMFTDAPLPYAHASAELFVTMLVIVGYRAWRQAPAIRVGARHPNLEKPNRAPV